MRGINATTVMLESNMRRLRFFSLVSLAYFEAKNANAVIGSAWHRVCEVFYVRNLLLLMLVADFTGCATEQPAMQAVNTSPVIQQPIYASAALAFDAPITLSSPYIDISRDDRGLAALVGFEEGNTSTYDVINDNRQGADCSSNYIRESITERSGVTHR